MQPNIQITAGFPQITVVRLHCQSTTFDSREETKPGEFICKHVNLCSSSVLFKRWFHCSGEEVVFFFVLFLLRALPLTPVQQN